MTAAKLAAVPAPAAPPPPPADTGLPTDIEEACLLIERLEIHRQCLDEAIADAYEELADLLDGHLAADPDLRRLL
jgi:hypothetical protein